MVASHARPDGDAIGSAMAMALALRALGKQAMVVTDGVPPVFLQPFPGVDDIQITTEVTETFDAALIMECSDLARTGVRGLERSPVINIDHHPGNKVYGAINWIDESAAACGEMAFTLIDALGVPISQGHRHARVSRDPDRHRLVPLLAPLAAHLRDRAPLCRSRRRSAVDCHARTTTATAWRACASSAR